MADKKTATTHNGRKSKNGAYSDRHNDRNYNYKKDEHIQADMTPYNLYYTQDKIYTHDEKENHKIESFSKVEKTFYEDHFSDKVMATNEMYIKARHYENVKTMDEYKEINPPEETILQVGDRKTYIDSQMLQDIFADYMEWKKETFPNVVMIDAALHVDETTPHIHMREVWIGHDKDGREMVNQTKALEEMGIERPDTTKKKDRYNNPKQTYTKLCREHFIELCEQRGIEINKEPKEASECGKTLLEYKIKKMKAEIKDLKIERQNIKAENIELKNENNDLIKKTTSYKAQIDTLKDDMEDIKAKKEEAVKELNKALTERDNANEECNKVYQSLKTMQDIFTNLIPKFQEALKKVDKKLSLWFTEEKATYLRVKEALDKPMENAKKAIDKAYGMKLDTSSIPKIHTDVMDIANTIKTSTTQMNEITEEDDYERG